MKVELHNEEPRKRLSLVLPALLERATSVDIAVAFMSKHGGDTVESIVAQLHGKAEVNLVVSVLFPTNLDRVARLTRELGKKINVWIHLAWPDNSERIHQQLHSKVIFIQRADRSRVIIVGSHNWTNNGLEGGNLEASVILTCDESDPVTEQTRQHIEKCKARPCERFDCSRLAYYQAIQQRYYPRLPQLKAPKPKTLVPGFSPRDALVILAEDGTDGELAGEGIVFVRVPESPEVRGKRPNVDRDRPAMGKLTWLYVFKKGSLFHRRNPTPKPHRLEGRPETLSENPDRLKTNVNEYLIDNLELPTVVPLPPNHIPELRKGEIWAVIPFKTHQKRELLPLFCSETRNRRTPQAKVLRSEIDDSQPTTWNEPITVVVKAPFEFAYPPTVERSFDLFQTDHAGLACEYQIEEGASSDGISYEIRFVETGLSAYVHSVTLQSEPTLTARIHGADR